MAFDSRPSFFGPPKLRDLFTIKLEDWFKVGLTLGLKKEELDSIRKKCQMGGDRECQKRMLALWNRKMAPKDHTQLLEALLIVGETKAVEKLQPPG